MAYETLNRCANDAWDVIQGRKKIVRNKIIQNDYKEESKESYGWLAPDGKFYKSDFGQHQTWASDYLLREFKDGNIEELSIGENPGDILINKGWILIHNPSGFQLHITRNVSKRMTLKQKDFLLEYFTDMAAFEWIKKLDQDEI